MTIYTPEQEAILDSTGNTCINGTAGSGKTSTLCSWGSLHPGKRKLALTYNTLSKEDFNKKKIALGVEQMDVYSFHSYALRSYFSSTGSKKIKFAFDLEPADVVRELFIEDINGYPNSCYLLGEYVSIVFKYFLSTTVNEVKLLKPEMFHDIGKHDLFIANFDLILNHVGSLFKLMESCKIPMLHDFYLRKFWESGSRSNYDAILVDEGQDATPIMIDILMREPAENKLIVGDEHQQIYSWRYATNALDKTGFDKLNLTSCFRFGDNIAKTANKILSWKTMLDIDCTVAELKGIRGFYPNPFPSNYKSAMISRGKTRIIEQAINMVATNHPYANSLYFEGGIGTYYFTESGISIYDVLNTYSGNREKVSHSILKDMKSFEELKEYSKLSNDHGLRAHIEMVELYKKDTSKLLYQLKDICKKERDEADIILTTVRKSKGLEFEEVAILDDFPTLNRLISSMNSDETDLNLATEEINLLYVAITRCQGQLLLHPAIAKEIL